MNKIPADVVEELKLKKPEKYISEKSKVIVEKHQISIKVPSKIRNELDLRVGSNNCEVTLRDRKTLVVALNG